ncbi:hypothetical protein pipiens_000446, partial [Culex pipiens pipiens]
GNRRSVSLASGQEDQTRNTGFAGRLIVSIR